MADAGLSMVMRGNWLYFLRKLPSIWQASQYTLFRFAGLVIFTTQRAGRLGF
jgi:hypothetical protein